MGHLFVSLPTDRLGSVKFESSYQKIFEASGMREGLTVVVIVMVTAQIHEGGGVE